MAKRGRPKGSRNKVTNEAKQAILEAYDALGGFARLVKWVNKDEKNEAVFWTKIFPRLLPRPAPEPEPQPEPAPIVRGALIWKEPEWAKYAKAEVERLRNLSPEEAEAEHERRKKAEEASRSGWGEASTAIARADFAAARRSGEPPTFRWEEGM